MGDEVSVWSNFWPHLSQTWQEASCVSCLRTLGLLKLSLALVASARQSLVSQKKIVFFLPGKPPCICGWELFHEDAVLWQGSASKLAPGVGLEGHKVTSGEWPPFHPGTRDLLVLGGSCPVFGKKDWGAAVVVNRLERLFYEKGPSWKNISLVLLPELWGLGELPQGCQPPPTGFLGFSEMTKFMILLSKHVTLEKIWHKNGPRSKRWGCHLANVWCSSFSFTDSRIAVGASLVAQMVKNLPAMQETWVWSLGWEDPLEKRMATHSSVLAWRIPWTEEPGGL